MIRDVVARAAQKNAQLLTDIPLTVQATTCFEQEGSDGLLFTFMDGFNVAIQVNESQLLTDAGLMMVIHTALAQFEVHQVVIERDRRTRIIQQLAELETSEERQEFFARLNDSDRSLIRSELFNFVLVYSPALKQVVTAYSDAAASVADAINAVLGKPVKLN